ncbi:hypothetical protein EG68_08953, partial [Paragonimus skrjabini miyazakii]
DVETIIEKHGQNLKCLEEKIGAQVNITEEYTPERIMTITGTVDQVQQIYEQICQTLEDIIVLSVPLSRRIPVWVVLVSLRLSEAQENQRRASTPLGTYPDSKSSSPPITLRLLVPPLLCGCIIGKGGSKINRIRELSGATIQVAVSKLFYTPDRTIIISGSAQAVSLCINQISAITLRLRCQPSGSFCPPEADNTLLHLHLFPQGLSGYSPPPQLDFALPFHLTTQTSYRHSNLVHRLSLGATAPIPNAWLPSSPYLFDSNSPQTINSNLTSIDPSRLLISPLFIDPVSSVSPLICP